MKEKFKFLTNIPEKFKSLEPEKKRLITICAVIVVVLVILTVISIIIPANSNNGDKIVGNLNNTGFATQKGNKVYISNTLIGTSDTNQKKGIYEIDKKGNAKLVTSDQYAKSMMMYEDSLYYIAVNTKENGNYVKQIIKMKPDGSKKEVIVDNIENTTIDDSGLNISDDWIYYLNSEHKIEKVKVNGEKRKQISDEEIDYFQIDGKYIYYLTKDYEFKRMKKDGSSNEEIEKGIGKFQVNDNNIYYISRANEHLMKLTIKDKKETEVISKKIKTFNIYDNTIYYATKENEDKAIYKSKINGSKEEKIVDISSENVYICVIDNWVYYTDKIETNYYEYKLYKVKANGEGKETINI